MCVWRRSRITRRRERLMTATGPRNLWTRWLNETGEYFGKISTSPLKVNGLSKTEQRRFSLRSELRKFRCKFSLIWHLKTPYGLSCPKCGWEGSPFPPFHQWYCSGCEGSQSVLFHGLCYRWPHTFADQILERVEHSVQDSGRGGYPQLQGAALRPFIFSKILHQ